MQSCNFYNILTVFLQVMVSVFFKSTDLDHIYFLEKGETVNAQSYIKNSLGPLASTINEQSPAPGTKKMKFDHDNEKPLVK